MTVRNFACAKDGFCDAWDGRSRYQWRKDTVEIRDWDYDETGAGTKVWRRCRPLFAQADRMALTDCYFSAQEWIKQAADGSAPAQR
jgi:hypothetical protein